MFEFFQIIYYLTLCWVIVKIFEKLFAAFKTFVLPDIIGECNLTEKYGSWAGSTDGIGKAYAKELAKRGLNIVLISRNAEKLQNTASEIENEFKVKTKFIVADFCEGPAVYEHIKTELENIPVAILVNNVGMTISQPYYVDEIPANLVWHMMYVNVASAVMMTNLILPRMKQRRRGAIINMSSGSESVPMIFNSLYSSSKAFLKHLTHVLQYETASFGISVQLLSPFFIKTNMTENIHPVFRSINLWLPDAETYAQHAIKTLGFSEHTTGYWPHGLVYSLGEMSPTKRKMELVNKYLKIIRRRFEKEIARGHS